MLPVAKTGWSKADFFKIHPYKNTKRPEYPGLFVVNNCLRIRQPQKGHALFEFYRILKNNKSFCLLSAFSVYRNGTTCRIICSNLFYGSVEFLCNIKYTLSVFGVIYRYFCTRFFDFFSCNDFTTMGVPIITAPALLQSPSIKRNFSVLT